MADKVKKSTFRKTFIKIFFLIGVVMAIVFSSQLMERNDAGWIKVKQGAVFGTGGNATEGNLSVRKTPGIYGQFFCPITPYKMSDAIYCSADALDGGKNAENAEIVVQLPDGNCSCDVVVQFELPLENDKIKELHVKYSSNKAVKSMIRQQIHEAVKNTGALMSSAEAYAERRPEFAPLAREIALCGLKGVSVTSDTTYDKDSAMIVTKRYNIKKDKAGKDVITKPSLLAHYGISLPQFNVKDMRFDKKTTGLIEARKDAQKAKQDAITAKAKGDAKVATAKATQEVLKQSAVTIAEKDRDVAKLKAEQEKVAEVIDAEKRKEVKALDALAALEEAKAMKTRANAKRQELVLAKGLSKYDEYRIKMECDRDVNVAKAMATWVGPVVAVNGGGSEGGSGLGDVLMLERYMEIAKKNGSQPVK